MKKPKKLTEVQLDAVTVIAGYRAAMVMDDHGPTSKYDVEAKVLGAVESALSLLGHPPTIIAEVRELLGCPGASE